ncbi:MAG: hypothetical protein KAI66_16980 [Lentisphaeria bacterium]|nr:hypothetical protein [Lentisphaeria bacterium]
MDVTIENEQSSARAPWRAPLVFLGWIVLGAFILPKFVIVPTDTLSVHSAVVDSLLAGQNWGRQALVGSLQYPLLPTTMLLLARLIASPFGGDGSALLVGLSQAWVLSYVVRLAREGKGTLLPRTIATVAVFLVFPGVLDCIRLLDPTWAAAVPLASALYHAYCWHQRQELRDALVTAISCGLLVFCGLAFAAAAIAILAVMTRHVPRVSRVQQSEQGGVRTLLWAPLAYCAFLWALWNWLVLGNPFFALRPVLLSLHACSGTQFSAELASAFSELGLGLVGGALICGLSIAASARGAGMCILMPLLLVSAVRLLCRSAGVHAAGGTLLTACLGGLAFSFCMQQVWTRDPKRFATLIAVFVATILAGRMYPPLDGARDGAFRSNAPEKTEVVELMDRHWPRARVLVCGIRAPALFHDPAEKRFLARADFHEALFLTQAEDEVMHLLVPPDNGNFYPRSIGHFSRLHGEGKPWLILEKQWSSGWQLWRCVIAPTGESKLDDL